MTDHDLFDAPLLDVDPSAHAPSPPSGPRLRRSRERRLLAGVAGGLAERFDVNVYLVRAIFVVLSFFWGLGVAIYLVMWIVMGPSMSIDEDSLERGRPNVSSSHRLTIAVCAAIVALGILAVAVLRPLAVVGPSLGLAWVIFLVVLAVVAVKTASRRVTIRRAVGLAFLSLASVAIIVVSGFLAFLASTGVALNGGNGDHFFAPSSFSQVHHAYRTEFGVATLDLSAVEFPATGFTLTASVAAGQLTIVVPGDAVVSLTTNVGAGTVQTSSTVEGISASSYTALPRGARRVGTKSSPHVTIDARVGVGLIDLVRATGAS